MVTGQQLHAGRTAAGAAPQKGAAAAVAPAAVPGSGVTCEERWECRRFEVAGVAVELRQDLKGSNALRPLDDDRPGAAAEDLSRVGLVVWQAGFVLAELLLRRPPYGAWHGAQVLDLGCGTGLVGLLLALSGAEVTLSDQPHILPLADANAQARTANLTPGLHRWRLAPHTWGQGDAAAALLPHVAVPPAEAAADRGATAPADDRAAAAAGAARVAGEQRIEAPAAEGAAAAGDPAGSPACCTVPEQQAPAAAPGGSRGSFDVITAADVVYQPEAYEALAATLRALAAPHTLVFVAFKRRGLQEERFLALLEERGFAVQEVAEARLAPEYRGGAYRVLRCTRIE